VQCGALDAASNSGVERDGSRTTVEGGKEIMLMFRSTVWMCSTVDHIRAGPKVTRSPMRFGGVGLFRAGSKVNGEPASCAELSR
jgi:hypothetical protein